jgi:hypothetical protein
MPQFIASHPHHLVAARQLVAASFVAKHPKHTKAARAIATAANKARQAGQTRQMRAARAIARATNQARRNTFLGINLTKDQRYVEADKNATKYQLKYQKCKTKREKKGKKAWPVDKKSGISGNCKRDYEHWKKWENKAAERALAYKGKLEKKGKLSKETEDELNTAVARPAKIAADEYNSEMMAYRRDAIRTQNEPPPAPEDFVVEGTDVEDEAAEESSMTPMLLIGGLFVVVGGGAVVYFTTRKG